MFTVEPLLTDALYSGHLLISGQRQCTVLATPLLHVHKPPFDKYLYSRQSPHTLTPTSYYGQWGVAWTNDQLGPVVSIIKWFHCMSIFTTFVNPQYHEKTCL